MILGVPVVDGHEMTDAFIGALAASVEPENFRLVIIDNGSNKPYKVPKDLPFKCEVLRNDENMGFYYPLYQLYNKYRHEKLIGLVHNDLLLYEPGWNVRMQQAFETDPQLGLVGLCGSNELDSNGGRGAGTMCFFRGAEVQVGGQTYIGQPQTAGRRLSDLQPACVLDSLFMMFKREAIPHLMNETDPWAHVTLAHFYDRIWPCRTIEAGFRCAVLGVECDHIGGITTTANERYRDDCIKWLQQRKIPYENPETEMYLVAERRFLGEYKENKRFLPCIVGQDYGIQHLAS